MKMNIDEQIRMDYVKPKPCGGKAWNRRDGWNLTDNSSGFKLKVMLGRKQDRHVITWLNQIIRYCTEWFIYRSRLRKIWKGRAMESTWKELDQTCAGPEEAEVI